MPVTDGAVYAIAKHNGTIYIGGEFNTVGPAAGHAALLDASTGIHDSSFPNFDGPVLTIISDNGGGWYVGGRFEHVSGNPCSNLAHILPNNTHDLTFMPNPNGEVRALALTESHIIVGGAFSSICAQSQA